MGAPNQVVEAEQVLAPPNPTRIVHYEHPDRRGEAWCGAPVQGVYDSSPLGCAVCAETVG